MTKNPFMKFYTSDWRSDPRLRMCSAAARGLWMEMLCLMHEATPYGHLLIEGKAPNDTQLAMLAGIPLDQITPLSGELETAGVFSRSSKGVIYSRRMVRDEKRSRNSQKNGQRGGNPTLCKTREKSEWVNPEDIPPDKPQIPDTRYQNNNPDGLLYRAAPENQDELDQAFDAWNTLARKSGLPVAAKLNQARRTKLRQRLKDCGGLAGWHRALERLAASPFCLGDNDRGWKANFDFLLQEASFLKLVEGAYGQRSNGSGSGRKEKPSAGAMAVLREHFGISAGRPAGSQREPDGMAVTIENEPF